MADLGWPASYDDDGNPDGAAPGAGLLGVLRGNLARYVVLPSPEAA